MDSEMTFHKQDLPEDYWKGYNALRQALRDGDRNSAILLINQGVRVNAEYLHLQSRTPLHLAVILRCPEIVDHLLTKGADIGAEDWNLDTPLTLAAKMENRDLLESLLLSGYVRNHENRECFSHLHIACMMNKSDMVKKLVRDDHAKSINKAVSKHSMFWPGYTPLHFAVHYGCSETVKYLLQMGVDMMAEDSRKMTPLHLAHLQVNKTIVDQLLEAHKYEFQNPMNQHGLSHFHIACTRDNTSVVEHFLKMDVEVDGEVGGQEDSPWQCFLPIHLAIYHGCPRVIKRLVEAGAYLYFNIAPCLLNYAFIEKNEDIYNLIINHRPAMGRGYNESESMTDLLKACIQNDMKDVRLFFTDMSHSSFNVCAPISSGLTILHLAVKYNCKEAVKFLLDQRADVLAQDLKDETPLHIAFRYKFDEIFDLLIEKLNNDTRNLIDANGLSIFHLLCTTNEIVKIENFIKTGIDVNAQVTGKSILWAGFTALHFACLFHQTEMVKLLLENGAVISLRNGMNMSSFDLVMRNLGSKSPSELNEDFFKLIISIPQSELRNAQIQGISALHTFCMSRMTDLEMMQQYLSSHENEVDMITNLPELRGFNKCTPLHFAVIFENLAQAQLLLKNGADPFAVNDEGKTSLEYMLQNEESPDFLAFEQNCFSLGKFNQSLSPNRFHVVCALGFSKIVKSILDKISDEKTKMSLLSCRDDYGRTPLHTVSFRPKSASKTEVTRLLLKHGASVYDEDCQLETPLHAACARNDFDVISLLVEHGSDVNAVNVYGDTPLHVLCGSAVVDDKRVLNLLLDSGCDIDASNECGITCLDVWQREIYLPNVDDSSFDGIQDCIVTCLEHVEKLKLIRHGFNERNSFDCSYALSSLRNRYLQSGRWQKEAFAGKCKKELESMRAGYIDRYTTLRDILGKNSHDMITYCENSSLKKILQEKSFTQKYPIYGALMKLQLKIGKIRRQLLIDSRKSLMNMIRMNLPQSCSESIFQYLDNKDLENIILSDRNLQRKS